MLNLNLRSKNVTRHNHKILKLFNETVFNRLCNIIFYSNK